MPETKKEILSNPWEDRTALPRLGSIQQLPAMLAMALAALQLACFDVELLTWITLPVLFAYVVYAVRARGSVFLILLTAVITTTLTGSMTAASWVLALIVGAGSAAWLFTVRRLPYVPVLLLGAVFGLSWFLSGHWQTALLAFCFLPAAIFLAYATVSGRSRTSVICFGTAGFFLTVLAVAALLFYLATGRFGVEAIAEGLEWAREWLVKSMIGVRDALIVSAQDADAENIDALIAQMKELWSYDTIRAVIGTLFNLIPGILIALCASLAFGAQLLQGSSYRSTGWHQVLTPETSVFTMSVLSAVLYYLSFLSMLFLDTTSMFGAVMQNVCLILLPGFCYLGVRAVFTSIRRAKGGARLLLILLCLSILCCANVSALFFAALWGANHAMMEALNRKMLAKLGGKEPRDDDTDGN